MAINLNLKTYGDQFRAFVNFANANANNADTLACIEGDEPGGLLDPEGKVRKIVAKTDDDKIKSFSKNQFFNRNDGQKALNNSVRDLFKETVLKVCGVGGIDDLPPSVLAVMRKGDYGAGGGHPLSVRRIRAVTDAIKALADEPFAVSGTSVATPVFKGAINAKLATFPGSRSEKSVALKNEMDRIAKNRFNLFFADDMKDSQSGTQTQFAKDHVRMVVAPKFKIGNETVTFDNETSLEDKKDVIAKFVRKDMNARFADLDGADRNKAHAVMSFIGQRFAICMQEGVNRSIITGQMREPPIKVGQHNRDASNSPLSFSFGDDGSLHVNCKTVYDAPLITHERPKGNVVVQKQYADFDAGSSLTYTADVEIDAAEFERMANTDYTTFDYRVADDVMQGQPGEDEDAAATMGQYRFGEGVKVSVTCTAVLNGGEMMMDDEF
jgi:hypothetical protein